MKTNKKKSQKPFRPLSYHLGNFFIILPLICLFYIYYPLVKVYFFPAKAPIIHQTAKDYYLSIPKISAYSPIVTNIDPWKETDYMPALKKGVAQAKGTSLPGKKGTTYLFAHSSDYPWNITLYNTAFFRLGELKPKDSISIKHGDVTYKYVVTDIKEVWPTDTQYLKNTSKTQLILQTCTPIGTAFKRLLVFAKPV